MSEPPSSTGAGEPSLPGRAKTPTFFIIFGQPALGSSSSPLTQLGVDIIPVSPAQNGVHGSASLPSLGAPEACSKSVCTVCRPFSDSGSDRSPFQPDPSG